MRKKQITENGYINTGRYPIIPCLLSSLFLICPAWEICETHRHTDATENITSSANAGGNKQG